MNNEIEILKAQIEALKQLVAIKEQIITDLNLENLKLRAQQPAPVYIPTPITSPGMPYTPNWYQDWYYRPWIVSSGSYTLPSEQKIQTFNGGIKIQSSFGNNMQSVPSTSDSTFTFNGPVTDRV